MKLTADLQNGILMAGEIVFPITCKVRNLKEGTRQSYEIVRTCHDNLPYDPCPFPRGRWNIVGLDWQKDKGFDPNTYGPVKILTDAWRIVNVWELDNEGDYLRETDRQVTDTCYWLHYSTSGTTLGCIRIASPEDAVKLAGIIESALGNYEPVQLEVI